MKFLDILLEERHSSTSSSGRTYISSMMDRMPLPLRIGETYQDRERIDTLLDAHWNDKRAWLRDEGEEEKHFIYGEVTNLGARQLIQLFELEGPQQEQQQEETGREHHHQGRPTIFYDLGSGGGKLVVQMFLENVVTASVGIELSHVRHLLAMEKWRDVQNSPDLQGMMVTTLQYDDDGKSFSFDDKKNHTCEQQAQQEKAQELHRVQFWHQNILEADFSNATHIFFSSLCFNKHDISEVSDMIAENHRRYGRLQVVIALTDLPALEQKKNHHHKKEQKGYDYWKKSEELIQMTWGMSAARIYKKCHGGATG